MNDDRRFAACSIRVKSQSCWWLWNKCDVIKITQSERSSCSSPRKCREKREPWKNAYTYAQCDQVGTATHAANGATLSFIRWGQSCDFEPALDKGKKIVCKSSIKNSKLIASVRSLPKRIDVKLCVCMIACLHISQRCEEENEAFELCVALSEVVFVFIIFSFRVTLACYWSLKLC